MTADLTRLELEALSIKPGLVAPKTSDDQGSVAVRMSAPGEKGIAQSIDYLRESDFAINVEIPPEEWALRNSWEIAASCLAADIPVNFLVEDPRSFLPVRRLVSKYGAKKSLVLLKRSANVDRAVGELPTRLSSSGGTIAVVEDIPLTEKQFRNVHSDFRGRFSQELQTRLFGLKNRLANLRSINSCEVIDLIDRSPSVERSLMPTVQAMVKKQRRGDIMIVVGEVIQDRLIQLHTGEIVSFDELQGEGKTIIVGCNSVRYLPRTGLTIGTGTKITYAEAGFITESLVKSLLAEGAGIRESLLRLQSPQPRGKGNSADAHSRAAKRLVGVLASGIIVVYANYTVDDHEWHERSGANPSR